MPWIRYSAILMQLSRARKGQINSPQRRHHGGLATVWTAWEKFREPVAPDAVLLSLAGAGALAVNLACAFVLACYRHHGGSLTKAAFLSARNDALANVEIVAAGAVTAFLWRSAWPDLVVGIAIAALNAEAARDEHRASAVP